MRNLCTDNTGSADQLLPNSGGSGVGVPTSPQRPCLTSALRRSSWHQLRGWELRCALWLSSRHIAEQFDMLHVLWNKQLELTQSYSAGWAFVADLIYTACHINTDDEKPSPVSASGSAGPLIAPPAKPTPHIFLDRLQELKTCRCTLLFEYLIQFCICNSSLVPHWVPACDACSTLLCCCDYSISLCEFICQFLWTLAFCIEEMCTV